MGTQTVDWGGSLQLDRFMDYMRCCPGVANSSLHKFSWSDKFQNGVVNILDVADISYHYGAPDPYWNTGQNALAPNVGVDPAVVDIGETATVSFYFGVGLFGPLTPNQVTGLELSTTTKMPCINPWFQSGCS
jgi:hypothetical protein